MSYTVFYNASGQPTQEEKCFSLQGCIAFINGLPNLKELTCLATDAKDNVVLEKPLHKTKIFFNRPY